MIVSFQLPEKETYAAKTSEGETKVAEVAMKNSVTSAEKPAEVGDSTLREGKYKRPENFSCFSGCRHWPDIQVLLLL